MPVCSTEVKTCGVPSVTNGNLFTKHNQINCHISMDQIYFFLFFPPNIHISLKSKTGQKAKTARNYFSTAGIARVCDPSSISEGLSSAKQSIKRSAGGSVVSPRGVYTGSCIVHITLGRLKNGSTGEEYDS